MNLGTILVIVLILFLIGALPGWNHSALWGGGYAAPSVITILLIVVIVLLATGRL